MNFSGCGSIIGGSYNEIGGDRNIGVEPFG